MSLLVFPTFTPGTGANFKFPLKQTPLFKTVTQTPASGRGELRIPLMSFPRWDFVLDIAYMRGDAQETNSAWQTFVNFYIAVFGAGSDWLFLHPYDHTVTNQNIGTGDGSTSVFTMYRSLVTGGAQDLIQNFDGAPTIKVAGVTQTLTTDYTIDQYGTLTFTAGHIPTAGQAITRSGQFFYRCAFLGDSWDSLQEELYKIWTNHEVKFRSILL